MKRHQKRNGFQSKIISKFLSIYPEESNGQSEFHLSEAEAVTKAKADLLYINSWGEAETFSFGPQPNAIKKRQNHKKEMPEFKGQELQSWSGQKVIGDYYKSINILNKQKLQLKVSHNQVSTKQRQKQLMDHRIRYSSSVIRTKNVSIEDQEVKKNQHFCQKYKQIKTELDELKRRKIRSKSQITSKQPLTKQIILRLQKDFWQPPSPPLSRMLTEKQTKIAQSQIINHKTYDPEKKYHKQSKLAEEFYSKRHKSNGKWIQCKKNNSNLTRIYKIE